MALPHDPAPLARLLSHTLVHVPSPAISAASASDSQHDAAAPCRASEPSAGADHSFARLCDESHSEPSLVAAIERALSLVPHGASTAELLNRPAWQLLLERLGSARFIRLLSAHSIFSTLPNDCLVQLTGAPPARTAPRAAEARAPAPTADHHAEEAEEAEGGGEARRRRGKRPRLSSWRRRKQQRAAPHGERHEPPPEARAAPRAARRDTPRPQADEARLVRCLHAEIREAARPQAHCSPPPLPSPLPPPPPRGVADGERRRASSPRRRVGAEAPSRRKRKRSHARAAAAAEGAPIAPPPRPTPLAPLLAQLLRRHQRTSYHALLCAHFDRARPSPAAPRPAAKWRAQAAFLELQRHALSPAWVSNFLRAVARRVVPSQLLGSRHNWRLFSRNLGRLVLALPVRDTPLLAAHMVRGLKTSHCGWLQSSRARVSAAAHRKRQACLRGVVRWVTTRLLLPLMRRMLHWHVRAPRGSLRLGAWPPFLTFLPFPSLFTCVAEGTQTH